MSNSPDPLVRLVCQCGSFRGKGTMAQVLADFERHLGQHHSFAEDFEETNTRAEQPESD